MDSALIKLDLESFRQRRPNNDTVTGVIYLELDGEAFPQDGWSDFPLTLLSFWIEAQLQLSQPERRQVRWSFMDGPFSVILSKVSVARSNLIVDIDVVSSCLSQAAEQVVLHCEAEQMAIIQVDGLRAGIRQLKANLINKSKGVDHSSKIEFRRDWQRGW